MTETLNHLQVVVPLHECDSLLLSVLESHIDVQHRLLNRYRGWLCAAFFHLAVQTSFFLLLI